ncbi:hypothetical protein JCM11491_003930 [Sporobolomyces phaffii]
MTHGLTRQARFDRYHGAKFLFDVLAQQCDAIKSDAMFQDVFGFLPTTSFDYCSICATSVTDICHQYGRAAVDYTSRSDCEPSLVYLETLFEAAVTEDTRNKICLEQARNDHALDRDPTKLKVIARLLVSSLVSIARCRAYTDKIIACRSGQSTSTKRPLLPSRQISAPSVLVQTSHTPGKSNLRSSGPEGRRELIAVVHYVHCPIACFW